MRLMAENSDCGEVFRVAVRKSEVLCCKGVRANFEFGSVAISLFFASLNSEAGPLPSSWYEHTI